MGNHYASVVIDYYYPVCICTAGLCICSRRLAYYVYNVYMWLKNWLFEVLLLENLLMV